MAKKTLFSAFDDDEFARRREEVSERFSHYQTVYRSIDGLTINPIQPKDRISDSAIRSLVETVLDSWFFAPLVVCDDIIVDGHRRWAAAKKVGIKKLNCIEVSRDHASPTVWFIWLNRASRNVKGNNWFEVWAASHSSDRILTLKSVPTKISNEIKQFVTIFGKTRSIEIGKEGKQSPNVVVYINQAMGCIERFKGKETVDEITPAAIGEWMLAHKQTLNVKHMLRGPGWSNQSASLILAAVKADRPLIDPETKRWYKLPRGRNARDNE